MTAEALRDASQGDGFTVRLASVTDFRRVAASVRDALGGLPGAPDDLTSCRLERLHFGGGIGPVAEYDMTFLVAGARERRRMFVQVPRDDPHDAFMTARTKVGRRLAEAGQSPAGRQRLVYLADIGAILRPEGLDERIDGLWLLAGGASFPRIAEAGPRPGWDAFETAARDGFSGRLLAHRLGKRAVLDLRAGAPSEAGVPSVIAKFYKRSTTKLAAIADRHVRLSSGAFAGSGDVRVPRILAIFENQRGLATDRAEGQPLGDIEGAAAAHAYHLGGKALACLHGARLDAPFHGPSDEQAMLSAIVSRVLEVDPVFEDGFRLAMAAVGRRRQLCQPFEMCLIHRDFHEKQVISDGERACLIDFDMIANGDPAQDLANFLAHLSLRELQTNEDMRNNVASFVEGYLRHRANCERENLEFHLSATFTRLASILAFSDRWRHLVPTLLAQAVDCPVTSSHVALAPRTKASNRRPHQV